MMCWITRVFLAAFAVAAMACADAKAEMPSVAEAGKARPLGVLRPRVPFALLQTPVFDPQRHSGRVVVKFNEGTGIRLRNGSLRDSHGVSSPINGLLTALGGNSGLMRVFSRAEDALAEDKKTGEEASGTELADLNLFYYFEPRGPIQLTSLNQLVERLNRSPDVEIAYFEERSELPPRADIAPTTPNYETSQSYLDAAPVGIDARYAWTVPGGRGLGVRFVDIEYGWNLDHEDLKDPFVAPTTHTCPFPIDQCNEHGTAVLGELIGDPNGFGVTGIVSAAEFSVEGEYNQGGRRPDAINVAAAKLSPGDVLVLEMQTGSPVQAAPGCGSSSYVPAEYDPAVFSAVQGATANQRIVVAAAGNGSVSLDDPGFAGRFDPSSPNFMDSGAIIVGARVGGTGPTSQQPACFSTFGSRVDASGWGGSVATTGYGNVFTTDLRQRYTFSFSGTSSATPIVAGAALAIQGMQRARGGSALGPIAMRWLLREFGTPQADSTKLIGKMPNLRTAHQWMIADADSDGMVNVDELSVGRNPNVPDLPPTPLILTIVVNSMFGS